MRGPRKPASYERRRKAAQASVEVLEATLSTLKEREVAVTSGEDRLKELPAQEKALVAKEVEVGEKLKAANEILERVVQDKTRVEKIGALLFGLISACAEKLGLSSQSLQDVKTGLEELHDTELELVPTEEPPEDTGFDM